MFLFFLCLIFFFADSEIPIPYIVHGLVSHTSLIGYLTKASKEKAWPCISATNIIHHNIMLRMHYHFVLVYGRHAQYAKGGIMSL